MVRGRGIPGDEPSRCPLTGGPLLLSQAIVEYKYGYRMKIRDDPSSGNWKMTSIGDQGGVGRAKAHRCGASLPLQFSGAGELPFSSPPGIVVQENGAVCRYALRHVERTRHGRTARRAGRDNLFHLDECVCSARVA